MKKKAIITFKIHSSSKELPLQWNTIAKENVFLSKEYLEALEQSAPINMICHYISMYKNEKLAAVCLSQFLNLNLLDSFGERDNCVKTSIRNFVFKNYCSHVLFIGNNMLTGQNAFVKNDAISEEEVIQTLNIVSKELKAIFKQQKTKVHLTVFKDFESPLAFSVEKLLPNFYKFSTQPNMVFSISNEWKNEADYINSLQKKYRDQYKRARKKIEDITKRKFDATEIELHEKKIYDLYFHVAKNAPFNTFLLAENHFSTMKKKLQNDFLFYGYFLDNKLIGFNTLIKNGSCMDTYFLGYDDQLQKDKMLYLNMLFDMIGYSIKKGFKEIIFARTALEIKSSVGAKPVETFGFMQHTNPLIDITISKLFCYLEPKTKWTERSPFK